MQIDKVAFGGGCHWCTEAVFQSLKGVEKVDQGWISSSNENNTFSEAVIVHFYSELISLKQLIEVHLATHKSTSNHSMREKYRSAIYFFSDEQKTKSNVILAQIQKQTTAKIITKVLPFLKFKPSEDQFQNYYKKNPQKPFCKKYIVPKLDLISNQFSDKILLKK